LPENNLFFNFMKFFKIGLWISLCRKIFIQNFSQQMNRFSSLAANFIKRKKFRLTGLAEGIKYI